MSKAVLLEKLNKGVDFLFGVLVAVSIEKAIEGFLHVRAHEWLIDPTHPQPTNLADKVPGILMVLRIIIFLGLVTTFYIGSSIRYFDTAYSEEGFLGASFKKRYTLDFFSGLMHFAFFFALSLSIAVAPGNVKFHTCYKLSATPYCFSSYSILLMAILLYDSVWLFVRKGLTAIWQNKDATWLSKDTTVHRMIWDWARPNLKIMFAILIVVALGGEFFPAHLAEVEEIALLLPLIYTFINFSSTINF